MHACTLCHLDHLEGPRARQPDTTMRRVGGWAMPVTYGTSARAPSSPPTLPEPHPILPNGMIDDGVDNAILRKMALTWLAGQIISLHRPSAHSSAAHSHRHAWKVRIPPHAAAYDPQACHYSLRSALSLAAAKASLCLQPHCAAASKAPPPSRACACALETKNI